MAAAGGRPGAEGEVATKLTTSAAARKAVRLARLAWPDLDVHESHFSRGRTPVRPSYLVRLPATPGSPLAGLADPVAMPTRACCRRAFLRGAFLAVGGISAGPGGNHVELAMPSAASADVVTEILASLGAAGRSRPRRARIVVYAKSAEDLGTLLAAMGASHAVLGFENARILRGLRGQANRLVNSETANMERNVASSLRQVGAVRRLANAGLLEQQPPALREIAQLRLAHPAESLEQLANRLDLTKAAVNNRLRRLVEVADERAPG